MTVVVLDPQPIEISQLIERRRRLGQDLFDEVWAGVLHMHPAPHGRHAEVAQELAEILGPLARATGLVPRVSIFNLGDAGDYRVPDGGLIRSGDVQLYFPTAALVLEIVSPGDETWQKLDFYAAHAVDEVLIVDPASRSVDWLALRDSGYVAIAHSDLVELGPAELAARLSWPA